MPAFKPITLRINQLAAEGMRPKDIYDLLIAEGHDTTYARVNTAVARARARGDINHYFRLTKNGQWITKEQKASAKTRRSVYDLCRNRNFRIGLAASDVFKGLDADIVINAIKQAQSTGHQSLVEWLRSLVITQYADTLLDEQLGPSPRASARLR